MKVETLELAHIKVKGVVQGVGFRPFVYQLAAKYDLKGWVCNTSEGVRIEVEGERQALKEFLAELEEKAPPRAHIESISTAYGSPAGYKHFEIRSSLSEEGKYQLVSPDIATCEACRNELFTSSDRRYHYPFTNCTNCGPRFTIIKDIPYDRPNTTMHLFQMCSDCQEEYDDPLNRRFHAQPNACPKCGPHLQLVDANGQVMPSSDVIASASKLLRQGKILAIKGLGGFLLACDATNEGAVKILRQRKRRPFKPFAIMVSSLKEAQKHCVITPEEKKLLASTEAPIVLLEWLAESTIAKEVAPNLKYLGIMLPYTPLHHLLLAETELPLVMTSGNLSEEPIAKDNEEAIIRLKDIADYFITHNRDIYARYDDSVTMVEKGDIQLVRRARGYAPFPIHLPFKAKQVLGCGAEVKNTFCFTKDEYAFLSQHIGDLENLETMEHFERTLELYKRLFRLEPERVAYDLHPEYLATKYALELAATSDRIKPIPIQHHHAHIVSCLVDNGIQSPVIGIAFDGTGYGVDGNIWGGEFLMANYESMERLGHLEYLPLPGGKAAIEKPYRIAIGYLFSLLGENVFKKPLAFLKQVDEQELELIKKQVERKLNSPLTSSMGRLFDAVSALIGIRDKIDYEGQAAIELEMIAYNALAAAGNDSYPFSITEQNGMKIIRLRELLSAIVLELKRGVSPDKISAKFHNSVAQVIKQVCLLIAKEKGLCQVALSGGVFQNRILLRKTVTLLEEEGFSVFTHRQVPANDGGISLGQAVIGNFI